MTGVQAGTLARREQLRQRIARHIQAHPGCDGNQIQAGVGGNRSILLQAVRDLIDRGDVIRWRDPAERRTCRYTLAADYQPEPPPSPPPPPQAKTCERCGTPLPRRKHRFCSDICRIRQRKKETVTENGEFGRAVTRMIRQMARRVGANDIAEFGAMWEVMEESERAVTTTIDGLRASGFSWAEIGAEVGWSKQRLSQWRQRRGGFSRQQSVYTGPAGTGDPA